MQHAKPTAQWLHTISPLFTTLTIATFICKVFLSLCAFSEAWVKSTLTSVVKCFVTMISSGIRDCDTTLNMLVHFQWLKTLLHLIKCVIYNFVCFWVEVFFRCMLWGNLPKLKCFTSRVQLGYLEFYQNKKYTKSCLFWSVPDCLFIFLWYILLVVWSVLCSKALMIEIYWTLNGDIYPVFSSAGISNSGDKSRLINKNKTHNKDTSS